MFAGLWGLSDPARPDAVQAIGDAREAGIKVFMLTDDNFAAIVHAVEEGRIIFEDLRRIVFYLVTDGVCVIPLGMEPKNRNVLSDPPIDPKSGIFNFKFLRRILILAPVMTAGTLGLFPGCSSAGMRRRREP